MGAYDKKNKTREFQAVVTRAKLLGELQTEEQLTFLETAIRSYRQWQLETAKALAAMTIDEQTSVKTGLFGD